MKTCKIKNCDSKYYSLDYCAKHYQRYKRHGNPMINKNITHNMNRTSEHRTWQAMKQRCYNPKTKNYHRYGGRGITVCDRWLHSFQNFFDDMGNRPFPKAQIDRKDNDGNYEPLNCRWVTAKVNTRNQGKTILNWFTVQSIRRLYTLKKYSHKQLSLIYNINIWSLRHIIYNNRWLE